MSETEEDIRIEGEEKDPSGENAPPAFDVNGAPLQQPLVGEGNGNTGADGGTNPVIPARVATQRATDNTPAPVRSPREVSADGQKEKTQRKKATPKNPTLHSQMVVLMEKLDRQAARTNKLYSMFSEGDPHTPPAGIR